MYSPDVCGVIQAYVHITGIYSNNLKGYIVLFAVNYGIILEIHVIRKRGLFSTHVKGRVCM